MPLDVYLDPCTINCRKVLAGLDLTKTPYEVKHVDYFKGEQKSPDYLKINPMATIPAAVDGDLVITESNAILAYGADVVGSPMYPKDTKQRAKVNSWLLWESSAWFPSCYKYVVEYIVKPILKSQPDQEVISKEEPNFKKLAGVLDRALGESKYLVGNEITIADVAVASPMHLNHGIPFPLKEFPNLTRWMQDIENLPEWKNTQAPVDNLIALGKGNA